MWTIVGYVARITGLGNAVSLLIVLGSCAAVLTGTYVYWKHQVVHQRDLYWQARMQAETDRINAILIDERSKSEARITTMLQKQIKLQEQVDADEEAIRIDPNRDLDGLGADGVRRIDSIH